MAYTGLSARTIAEVRALNRCFLRRIREPGDRDTALSADWLELVRRLGAAPCRRVAEAPFLLLDVGKLDLGAMADTDLFSRATRADTELWLMTLSLCWQFAQREPFALRVISGAGLEWCDALGDTCFAELADRVGTCAPPPRPALLDTTSWWADYAAACTGNERGKVAALQMAGLQHRLCNTAGATPLASAASRLVRPGQRVAEPRPRG